jgi:hypothetical protein
MSILLRIEAFKDLLQEVVDKGAQAAEHVHQSIATAPLDAMKHGGLLDGPKADALKQMQVAMIGQAYGVVRRVNKEVGDFTSAVIESLENHAEAQRNIGRPGGDDGGGGGGGLGRPLDPAGAAPQGRVRISSRWPFGSLK